MSHSDIRVAIHIYIHIIISKLNQQFRFIYIYIALNSMTTLVPALLAARKQQIQHSVLTKKTSRSDQIRYFHTHLSIIACC